MSNGQPSTSGRVEPQWDFLKGSGPSSALYYFAPLRKEGEFKPGWKSKRPQAAIKQDMERKNFEAYKEQRSATCCELRRERLQESQNKNRFNPISHQTHALDGSWKPDTDPWQHQRVGIPAKEPRSAAADILRTEATTARRNVGITELRRERLAHGGLSQHPGGTMKEVLTWGSAGNN